MGLIKTFAAFLAGLGCVAACTSTSGTPPVTRTPPHTTVAPPTTQPPTTQPATSSSDPGPPHPAQPSIPADVPRTGPNTKPGEKPPLMPLEATQHTPDGAKAFAAFFIKTIDWGYATTSSTYMRHYFTRACIDCRGFADSIDAVRAKSNHYIGGRFTVTTTNAKPRPFVRSAERTVGVMIDVQAYEEVTKSGKYVRASGAEADQQLDVSIHWRSNSWAVVALAAQQ